MSPAGAVSYRCIVNMSRPGAGAQDKHEKRLRDVILTAVRSGYTEAVERAAGKMKAFEEKHNLYSPTPGDLLDFCDFTEKQVCIDNM